jgi:hypothetical protein
MSKKSITGADLIQECQQVAVPFETLFGGMAPIVSSLAEEQRVRLGLRLQRRIKTRESILCLGMPWEQALVERVAGKDRQ